MCTEEEREAVGRGSRKGDKLYDSLMKGAAVPKFAPQAEDARTTKAKEHKDRLIQYDKTRCVSRYVFLRPFLHWLTLLLYSTAHL